MKKALLLVFLCSFAFCDWTDVTTIKNIMQNNDSWKDDFLDPMLHAYSHIMLYGYDYSLTAGGDYTTYFWPDNYGTFWKEYKGENYPGYVDKTEDYINYAVSITGIPRNWSDYAIGKTTADNFLYLDVFSDTVNRSLNKITNDQNGYGLNDIGDTTTFTGIKGVEDKVVTDFNDALSNVDDYLFVLNLSSIGEFYVNACSSLGLMVNNPWSDFVYRVSLIPDEINNPLLYSLYTYWPLKDNNPWRNVFKVCLYLLSFVFMINKIKEITSGELT